MFLSELKTGETAVITKVFGHGGFRRRILEMGFVKGQSVTAILNAPLKDPIKYKVMGYEVSLRRSEARMIEVVTDAEAQEYDRPRSGGDTPERESVATVADDKSHEINIALVGNPNSGKTSLFNALSGGHEHVGNYSGVTVDAKYGEFRYANYKIRITDLPGTYALTAYTPEEIYVRRHLMEKMPDVVVNAVVASNLERNLYLTTELIDANPRIVVALNMYDELEASGAHLDYDCLGRMLGVPMVPVVARSGKGLEQLLEAVIAVYENRDDRVRHIHITHSAPVEEEIGKLSRLMKETAHELPKYFPPRYWAMKMLEGDKEVLSLLSSAERFDAWSKACEAGRNRIRRTLDEDVETALTDEKYGFIEGALKETFTPGKSAANRKTTFIDSLVTHKYLGFPIFILLMALMFSATFVLGAYPQAWLARLVSALGDWVTSIMPAGILKDLITDGIIGGVGSVIVFLPNILILYLFISLMEDSGYMARAAFIMDRIMHRIGLHGKSFIPLIMGFGCNVPAIMASRTIESRSSRIITILINPFMSCSARLPVFILLAGTFFPEHSGAALTAMYLGGVLMAMLSARIMRRAMFREDETPFVMELPPYRIPTLNATLRHMWDKAAQYLRKMGGVILVASIAIWFLSYFPRADADTLPETADAAEYQAGNSYLGRIGRAIEPCIEPLGLNWKAGVALISGTAAKEIIVSTLGVLYPADKDAPQQSLETRLTASGDFTRQSALAFMVFILLYFPCIATLSAIAHEAGRKWALFSAVYNTALAWLSAWIVYMLAGLL